MSSLKQRSLLRLVCMLAVLASVWVHGFSISNANPTKRLSHKFSTLAHSPVAPHISPRIHGSPVAIRGLSRTSSSHPRWSNSVSALSFRVAEAEEEAPMQVEELNSETETDGGLANNVGFLRKISVGAVPLAITLGFAVTPSPSLAIRAAGATLGGVAGFVARRALVKRIQEIEDSLDAAASAGFDLDSVSGPPDSVKAALKSLSNGRKPLSGLTLRDIESAGKKARVPADQLTVLFTLVFSEVIYAATAAVSSTQSDDWTALYEVLDFAGVAGLTPSEIGDGFALAALKIAANLKAREDAKNSKYGKSASSLVGFLPAKYPRESLLQAAQIFFLADKMIGAEPGLGGFYGKRLETALASFSPEAYQAVITASCRHLFRRCVESVIADPKSFSPDEVAELRSFLTTRSPEVSSFRPANMQQLVTELVQGSIDGVLRDIQPALIPLKEVSDEATITQHNAARAAAMHVSLDNYATLAQAQEVLLGGSSSGGADASSSYNPVEFERAVAARVVPVFEVAARQVIGDVLSKPEHLGERYSVDVLDHRMAALRVPIGRARTVLVDILNDENERYNEKIEKVRAASKEQFVEPVFQVMAGYANGFAAVKQLTDRIMDGNALPVPGLPFDEITRINLYEKKLRDGDAAAAAAVGPQMFDLDAAKRAFVKKAVEVPKVTGWIAQCLREDNLEPAARAAYQKQLEAYSIGKQEWRSTALDFYYQEVRKIGEARAVPSVADLDRLAKVRSFLGLSDSTEVDDSINKVHMSLLGDKYLKALTECMTPTGVIAEDYVDGLDRLRQRLGLTKQDAATLLGVSSRNRMEGVVKSLLDQYKTDTDPQARAEKERAKNADKSRDPVSSLDTVLGYVDGNGVGGAQKEGGGPNVFMREALNLIDFFEENYASTVGVQLKPSEADEVPYPVTAVGLAKEEELVNLYKHYAISRVSESDPSLAERYATNEGSFGRVLGLSAAQQAKVKESLAFTASKGLIRNMLQYRDAASPADLQQLAVLADKLGLDKAAAERILDDASRNAALEHASMLFDGQPGGVNADVARRFRLQVQSLGLEISKDLQLNRNMLALLYAVEVQDLIESDQTDYLQDVQEAYDVPDDGAELIVEACAKRYINQLLNLALRGAKRFDEKDAMRWLKPIIKFSSFVPGGTVDADGAMFSNADKARLISIYERSQEFEEPIDSDARKEVIDRLQSLINVSIDYVSPLEGIEGLLGNVKDLNQIMIADPKANKKRWAWG